LQAARGPERILSTNKGVLSPKIETKRRRSSANLDDEARAAASIQRSREPRDEIRRTHADAHPSTHEDAGADEVPPVTTDDLNRTSETESLQEQAASRQSEERSAARKKSARKSRTNEGRPRTSSVTDEWDAQATQSLSRAELDSITNEHAPPPRMLAPRAPKDLLPAAPTSPRGGIPDPKDSEPSSNIVATQAVRVIVWRDAEGVHVAPAGTIVSAITVDAMLVAMDPSADLSMWLDPGRGITADRGGRSASADSRAESSDPGEGSASGTAGSRTRGKIPK
jgi:hypothetical protein